MVEKEVAEEHITIKRRITTNSEHKKKELPITPELIEAIETQGQPQFENLDEFAQDVKKLKTKTTKKSTKKTRKTKKAKTTKKTKKAKSKKTKKAKTKKAKSTKKPKTAKKKKTKSTVKNKRTTKKKKSPRKAKTTLQIERAEKRKRKVPKFKDLQKSIITENVLSDVDVDKLHEASELAVKMLENVRKIAKKEEPSEEEKIATEKFGKLTKRFDDIIDANAVNIDSIQKCKEIIKTKGVKKPVREARPHPIPRQPLIVPKLKVEVDKPPPVAPKKSFMQKLVDWLEHLMGKK